jgi:hypothetical protein
MRLQSWRAHDDATIDAVPTGGDVTDTHEANRADR